MKYIKERDSFEIPREDLIIIFKFMKILLEEKLPKKADMIWDEKLR